MIKGKCKTEIMALRSIANTLRLWEVSADIRVFSRGKPTPTSWKTYYENQNRALWKVLKKVKYLDD